MTDYLRKFGQEHLVKYWEELDEVQKNELTADLERVDVSELSEYYERVKADLTMQAQELDALMQPIPKELTGSYENSSPEQLRKYELDGLRAIANNEVAVLLLAGGQGTRLGTSSPKGMYSVKLPSDKSLYQIQAERLVKLREIAEKEYPRKGGRKTTDITWYIMTSEHTMESTREFFRENDYFGLDKDSVVFFEQYMLPCLTMDGKIILDQKHKISKASDGNGGLYKALLKRRILDDMAYRGIKYVHVFGIDNILVKTADPVFIGFCNDKQADCAAKVVKKVDPEEKVGVICKVNNQFQVVEYSEISKETRNLREQNGDLTYNAGSICNHFFTVPFLYELCLKHEQNLKHHIAEKKIPYVDEYGVRQCPAFNNGIKLEKFVFDVFPYSTNFAIWEVLRKDEFSPLKNADSAKTETPTTCRFDIYDRCSRWLEEAGATFEDNYENDEDSLKCEISPLVSYDGENLKELVNGQKLRRPLVIDLNKEKNMVTFNGLALQEYQKQNYLI